MTLMASLSWFCCISTFWLPSNSGLTRAAAQILNHPSALQQSETATVEVLDKNGDMLFVDRKTGQPVLRYRRQATSRNGAYQRANYIHPLYDLNGNVITEDFPEDHLHQRGIFWAWHQVFVGQKAAGDSWLTQDFIWHVKRVATAVQADGAAMLTTRVNWLSPKIKNPHGKLLEIVHETTRLTVFPAADNRRIVDFEISLLAAQPDVSIGGSDDEKGYGGFSARLALPKDVSFDSAAGPVIPKSLGVNCGSWINICGNFAPQDWNKPLGQPVPTASPPSGIAIFVHPSSASVNDTQSWILRSSGSMQNPLFPGRQPIPLSQSKPTVLRYRLVLQRASVGRQEMNKLFEAYAATEFPGNHVNDESK